MDAHKLWMLRDFIGTNKVYSKYRYIKGTMIGLSRIAIGCWRISMILSIVERNIFWHDCLHGCKKWWICSARIFHN